MTEISYFADRDVDARTALARGAGTMLLAEPGRGVLYGAVARDEALALGRWQRRPTSGVGADAPRRATGGPTACLGPGVLYLALGLHDASELMACPRDRVLNRNVRGFLGGLSALSGEPVLHFGREWLSRRTTPVALVGWHRDARDRVLVEVFASIGAPFSPARAYREHVPGSISPRSIATGTGDSAASEAATPHAMAPGAMVEAIARGHAARYPGVTIAPASAPPTAVAPPPERDRDVERWSAPYDVPIGTVSAGLTLDAAGRIVRARIAGDVYADETAIDTLERTVSGLAPDELALGRAIDDALGPGRGVVEGLRSLRPLLDALLEAAGQAGPARPPS